MKPILLLSTLQREHAARSGYEALAAALPEARFLNTIRREPKGGLKLFGARVARRFSFSRWYLGGCAELEWKAWKELRAGFSGIIHCLWADHDLGYLDLVAGGRRNRFVGSFHNCDDTFIHTIRYPRRLRRFDAIILMSRTQEQFFLDAGVAPERIHVVRHGVDTSFFRPLAEAQATAPEQPFTVLAAGGYRRNFPLLREVCLRFKDDAGMQFVIIAPPAFREAFAEFPHVRFLSGLPDEEFLRAYQTASCLLQTVENATANNVVMEALACGLPVVSERIGGIPEYVDDTCSLLTAPRDADALAAALIDLRASPARRNAMAAAARRLAETLDWSQVAARMREIYATL